MQGKEDKPTYFTYLIGWKYLDRWYYGVRLSKKSHPDDLWTKYFTSSKIVKKMRQEIGEPDVIEVRRTFTDRRLAEEWEHKVLRRLCVMKSERWLNQSLSKGAPNAWEYPEAREKLLEHRHSPEFSRMVSIRMKETNERMRKEDPEKFLQIRMNNRGTPKSRTEGYVESAKRMWSDPERKMKQMESMRGKRTIVTCPHCNLSGGGGNMRRYHFDKCKQKAA